MEVMPLLVVDQFELYRNCCGLQAPLGAVLLALAAALWPAPAMPGDDVVEESSLPPSAARRRSTALRCRSMRCSASGGYSNAATGSGSSVSGGSGRSVSGSYDWRAGALFEDN
jgi:uncharacterized membrane protein YgcG